MCGFYLLTGRLNGSPMKLLLNYGVIMMLNSLNNTLNKQEFVLPEIELFSKTGI